MGLRTIKNGKRVIGILFGIIALIEGIFAIYIAKPTAIKSIGGITQTTFALAATSDSWRSDDTGLDPVQSKIMEGTWARQSPSSCFWPHYRDHRRYRRRISFQRHHDGYVQGVSKKFIALGGAQLFIMGMVQFSLWIRRDEGAPQLVVRMVPSMLTVVLLGEGLLMVSIASDTLSLASARSPGKYSLAGLQLLLLPGFCSLCSCSGRRNLRQTSGPETFEHHLLPDSTADCFRGPGHGLFHRKRRLKYADALQCLTRSENYSSRLRPPSCSPSAC